MAKAPNFIRVGKLTDYRIGGDNWLIDDSWAVARGLPLGIDPTIQAVPPTISLSGGVAYTQDFDTLSNVAGSTTNNLVIDGWAMTELGGGARDNEQYAVDTGGSTTGDTYSYGLAAATDRALGELRSGTLFPNFGAAFTNNAGATVTSLLISYTGEQWRFGGVHSTVAERLDFQISFDATSLTTGTWIDVNELDFTPTVTTGTATALNGNTNSVAISFTITSLTIANGATFWIRFQDVDATGADDGLAVDNFSITANTGGGNPGALSINDVSVAEGNSGTTPITFTVSRAGGSTGAVGATWTATLPGGVGGADSSDFGAGQLFTGTVSFADGETSQTITLNVQGDVTIEPDETFTVTLSAPTGGATISDADGTGTITNDDVPALPTISIADAQDTEVDPPNTKDMVFIVTLSQAPTSGFVTVDFTTMDGTALATTTGFNNDYVTTTGQVVFGVGETTKEIRVPVRGDTDVEPSETFSIILSNPVGATIADGTAVGTIIDNDVAQTVSIGDASVVEGNNGVSYLVFTVSLAAPATAAATVDFSTANGTATAGSDYVALSGTVSFAVGETSHTVSIPIIGDTHAENAETLTVTLSNPSGVAIGDGVATGTITNDDGPQYFALSGGNFTQDWTNIGQITANDNWSGVPFIIGYLGDIDPAGATTNVDPRTLTGAALGAIDVVANQTNPNITNGGVAEFHLTNPVVALQGSGTADAPSLVLYMDATGRSDIRLQANLRDIDATTDDAAQQINVQYRTSSNGTWTNVPGAYFSDVTTAGSATQVTAVDVILPPGANGAGTLEIRIMTTNAAGNDEWVGIDDIVVSSLQSGPSLSIENAAVVEGDSGPTPISFTVIRNGSPVGAVTANYTVSLGSGPFDANAADFVSGQAFSGVVSFADGQTSATITLNVQGDTLAEGDDNFTVTLSDAVGGTIVDGSATGTIVNDDGPPSLVTINDVSVVEGQSGTSLMTFTVTRTGGSDAFTVDFDTADGSATAGSDYVADSGTLSFGIGENSQTISITINGDTDSEVSETLQVLLSGATGGALITDGTGIGTIVSDDPIYIHDIQGTAYFSPILAAEGINSFNVASAGSVIVRAVVTAVDNVGQRQGYYITEETTDWDGNTFTSEGIFVMTRNDAGVGTVVSGVSVGDLVQLSAHVMEYQSFSSMPRTVLVNPTGLSIISSGNTLPTITLTNMPNAVLTGVTPDYFDSSDGAGDTFDASVYALSYFETVEGMLVTIPNMVVADGFVSTSGGDPFLQAYSLDSANPGQINSRGGYTIAGDPPVGPPDTATPLDDTNNGGRALHDGDVNPDIIELDFTDFATAPPPGLTQNATMGDHLGNVTGIIDFDFTDRKLFVTDINPGSFVNNIPVRETTSLGNDDRALTIATFNVENLDPGDGAARFAALAQAIANNLNAPDILCIEEMQDNNGATASGGADASITWQMLVDALNAATGKVYQWVDQEPNGSEGGEPGGNIRVGFLYDTARVQLGDLDANATLAERRQYTDRIGDGVRDAGDLIAFDDSMIAAQINTADWSSTRRSLLGEFTFHGNVVYVTANHFTAKGGSGEFWQFDQDPANGDPENAGWAKRTEQALDVYTMLNLIESGATGAGIIAGGDFNDFYFYRPLTTLTGYTMADGTARVGGARFDNLTLTLPEAERYTYTFDGRSQAIDHIVVNNLMSGVATYDVVHINTGYNALGTGPDASPRLSDHDPGLSSFDFRNFSEVLNGTAGADTIDGLGGNDIIRGGEGDDAIDGGIGTDTASYAGNVQDYTIVPQFDVDGNLIGFLSVTDNNPGDGDEGTDTLTSIERLTFANATLNAGDSVLLFDGSDNLVGTFTSIQAAIDAAANGYSILALAATYTEDLVVDVDVTIRGANDGVAGTGTRGAETIIDGSVTVTAAGVTIDGVEIIGEFSSASTGGFNPGVFVQGNDFVLINSVLNGPDGDFILDTVGVLVGGGVTGLDIGHNLITGYLRGVYIVGGSTAGSVHDNLFQGEGSPFSGEGMGNGINSETSHVLIQANTFDGIWAGVINVAPMGPDPVDLDSYIIGNIFTNNAAARPIQVYPTLASLVIFGTDESEAFNGDISGVPGQSFAFHGMGGNDHIYGGELGDVFLGGDGNDAIWAKGGNDSLNGGAGSDLLDGGAGIDTASFSGVLNFNDTVIGWITTSADGNDVLQNVEIAVEGSGRRNLLVGSTGFGGIQAALDAAGNGDAVRLAAGTYTGTWSYSDSGLVVLAQTGARINGTFTPTGTDGITVVGANLADNITTGAGNDVISGGAGADTMAGGAGDDRYIVDNAGDLVTEAVGGGNDTLVASVSYALAAGVEVELMTTGSIAGLSSINLVGNELANQIWGNNGANMLSGGGGADILIGFGGDDQLIGGAGGDTMLGGLGNDTYYVDDAGDSLFENAGEGSDQVVALVDYTLTAGSSIELMTTGGVGNTNNVNLTGNELDQQIWGNNGANVIDGGAGTDVLLGFGGADAFKFSTALGAGNVDAIVDYSVADDSIQLDDAVFTALSAGALSASAFVVGTAAADADDRIIYDSTTGNLFYDADGVGGAAAVQFAVVIGTPALTASEFTVI